MNPCEIQLKSWVIDEASRCGLTRSAIYNRIYRGKHKPYRAIKFHRINRRVVFVKLEAA